MQIQTQVKSISPHRWDRSHDRTLYRTVGRPARAWRSLQRKCACGGTPGPTGECAECRRKRLAAPGGPVLQTSLAINEPGDKYEQEADRVADRVMRMPGPRLQRQAEPEEEEEETIQSKSIAGQITPFVQRQVEPEEEDEEEDVLQTNAQQGSVIQAGTDLSAQIQSLKGRGQPLPPAARHFFEPRFGFEFSQVRIHNDAPAARMARSINARAFTVGNDIAFAADQFAPASRSGQRLLAHELTHVVQQGGARTQIARDLGETRDGERVKEVAEKTVTITAREEGPGIQRVNGDEPATEPDTAVPPTPANAPAPAAPAAPTLSLTPGDTLTRGDSLTATVDFTPQAGETLNVTGWEYSTADHGDITRPASDADFQTAWSGTMALSGTMTMTFQITPSGGTAGAEQTVTRDITVNDRTGTDWVATITDQAERDFASQPSPPRRFNQLGRHRSIASPLPSPTGTTINSGPNRRLRFVSALRAGTFFSRPFIHPDLNDDQSAFRQFHLDDSVLFLVVNNTRRRIPPGEYSNFSQSPLSFDVPNWETFYQTHNFYRVTATAGQNTVALQDAWWGLDDNAEDAGIEIRDEAAVRTALGIGATDAFSVRAAPRGSWSGFALMPSADILTGTRSHEYQHGTHSHRANFHKMMRALDPQRKIEQTISSGTNTVNFTTKISDWWDEITEPNHEIVDESASRDAEEFVATAGETMAGVNTDPDTGDFLGNVWNIHGNQPMS